VLTVRTRLPDRGAASASAADPDGVALDASLHKQGDEGITRQ
jgi:hypothetical protein